MRGEATGGTRRSSRVLWRSPVIVVWAAQGGLKVREHAETEVVNAHGALLRLETALRSGKRIELLDPRSNEFMTARVVWSRREVGSTARAGVELSIPSETFWGIYTPIQAPLSGRAS